ncbi:hypothetical protein OA849_00450, partial [Candidatus Pelagibacter sp.]|nr:hypothetical protein [Candidatus Pelagibacter sp.]
MLNQRQVWFSFFILFFCTSTNAWSLTYLGEADKYFLLFDFFFKKQKYLIFLVVFLSFINFLKKKRFFISVLFFLFQIFIIAYWDSLIIYFESLAGDSLSEINTFNISYIIAWL